MFSNTDVVGLDVGVFSIKAVRVRRTLSGRRLVKYFRRPIPIAFVSTDFEQRIGVVKEFMHANRLAGLPVMTSLSCSDMLFRTIGFPFRDVSKVGQLVPNEVESLIPLPLEEVAVGYQVYPPSQRLGREKKGPMTHALVAVAPAQTLTKHIQRMRDAGVEPRAVQPDSLALFSLWHYMRERRAGFPANVAIIDIGASKTMICVTLRGCPWLMRTVCYGVNHLIPTGDGLCMEPGSHEEHKFSSSKPAPEEPALGALIRDLRLTLHTYQSTAETPVRHVLFCGGGAGLPALTDTISRQLTLQPIHVPFLHHVRWRSAYSVALGLALLGHPAKGSRPFTRRQINRGIDLKRVLEQATLKEQGPAVSLKRLALLALLVALLGLADMSTHLFLKERQLHRLSGQLRSTFLQHFPNTDGIADEVEQAKARVTAARKAAELTGGDEGPLLPRLAAIVKQLPKDINLRVSGLSVEPGAVHIEGETDSFESVELMKRELQALPNVRETDIRDLSVGPVPGQVLFRLIVTMS